MPPLTGMPALRHHHRVADLIEHLESHLGPLQSGSAGDESTPHGVQVAWFGPDVPFTGVTTLVTVGLSRYHLTLPGGEHLHQELLMHVPSGDTSGWAAGHLFFMAGRMVERRSALPNGQVITQSGPMFPDTEITGFVATSPRYLPEEFAVCPIEEDVPAVVVWLAPVTTGEAAYAREHGWPALERLFREHDPDLCDPRRPEVPLTIHR